MVCQIQKRGFNTKGFVFSLKFVLIIKTETCEEGNREENPFAFSIFYTDYTTKNWNDVRRNVKCIINYISNNRVHNCKQLPYYICYD